METSWMTTKQAAEYLQVSPGFLEKDRLNNVYKIPFYKIGVHIRYKKEDLDEWLEKSRGSDE